MNWWRVLIGFAVSMGVGHIFLFWLLEKVLWPFSAKKHGYAPEEKVRLSWFVGVVERLLYTGLWFWGLRSGLASGSL